MSEIVGQPFWRFSVGRAERVPLEILSSPEFFSYLKRSRLFSKSFLFPIMIPA